MEAKKKRPPNHAIFLEVSDESRGPGNKFSGDKKSDGPDKKSGDPSQSGGPGNESSGGKKSNGPGKRPGEKSGKKSGKKSAPILAPTAPK
jgi:hypothetical protein